MKQSEIEAADEAAKVGNMHPIYECMKRLDEVCKIEEDK